MPAEASSSAGAFYSIYEGRQEILPAFL